MNKGKLDLRYELFAREYVIDLNGSRAAVAAGYSESTAKEQASRLLTNSNVRKRIDALLTQRATKLELKAEKVLEELQRMAFANMQDYIQTDQHGDAYVDLSALSRDQAAAIQEITVEEYTEGRGEYKRDIKRTKFKLGDKRGSLELLGKHLKLFTDVTENKGTVVHEHVNLTALSDAQLAQVRAILESVESSAGER